MQGHMGKYQGQSGERRSKGKIQALNFIEVFMRKNGQRKLSILRLANLNNFSKICVIVVVPSCPVSTPGVIYGRGNIGLECESLIKQVVGNTGLQIGCFVYKTHAGRQVVYNLQELGIPGKGSLPRISNPSRCQNIYKIQKIKNIKAVEMFLFIYLCFSFSSVGFYIITFIS